MVSERESISTTVSAGLLRFIGPGMAVVNPQNGFSSLTDTQKVAANPWYYEMPELGMNYRASDINCALGLSQLSKLGRFMERRRSLAARYDEQLGSLALLVVPMTRVAKCQSAFHLYPVLVDFERLGFGRAEFMKRLTALGIGSQVHYVPVHLQPYYSQRYGDLSLPGAESYYQKTLSLPLFPAMDDTDVDRVVAALKDILGVS